MFSQKKLLKNYNIRHKPQQIRWLLGKRTNFSSKFSEYPRWRPSHEKGFGPWPTEGFEPGLLDSKAAVLLTELWQHIRKFSNIWVLIHLKNCTSKLKNFWWFQEELESEVLKSLVWREFLAITILFSRILSIHFESKKGVRRFFFFNLNDFNRRRTKSTFLPKAFLSTQYNEYWRTYAISKMRNNVEKRVKCTLVTINYLNYFSNYGVFYCHNYCCKNSVKSFLLFY